MIVYVCNFISISNMKAAVPQSRRKSLVPRGGQIVTSGVWYFMPQ